MRVANDDRVCANARGRIARTGAISRKRSVKFASVIQIDYRK
jgi:hypothetical protein